MAQPVLLLNRLHLTGRAMPPAAKRQGRYPGRTVPRTTERLAVGVWLFAWYAWLDLRLFPDGNFAPGQDAFFGGAAMDFLVVVMWGITILAVVFVMFCFVGMFLLEGDKAKANRYLADKFDQERRKGRA